MKNQKLALSIITPGCLVCRLTARPDGRPLLEPTTAQPIPYTPKSIGDALQSAGLYDYEWVKTPWGIELWKVGQNGLAQKAP